MVTNQDGLPVYFSLTGGEVHDITQAKLLLRGLKAKALLADKGYVGKPLRRYLQRKNIQPVIPPRTNAKHPCLYDRELYKQRNRIERCFNKLKHFRRLATRFDRNDAHFKASITLASIALWLRYLYVDSA
jgi:transposase